MCLVSTNKIVSNICVVPNEVQVLLFLANNDNSHACFKVLAASSLLDLVAYQELMNHSDAGEVSKHKSVLRYLCE